MCTRKKVLSVNNGSLYSKVVFIAEAPGRLGAECTGIPLYGDKTGENFEMLLGNIEWKRDDVFITNSILCNPQDEKGNNSTPTKEEIENCSYYLEMTLKLINPDIIVTLGVKALEALKYIENHNYVLRDCVAQKVSWNNKCLFPIYHMGPRAAIHRSINKQRSDFIILSHIVDPVRGIKKHSTNVKKPTKKNVNLNNILLDMVVIIVTELRMVSFFKLTKLLYLIDYYHYKDFGNSISESIYLRMQDGPWIPTLKNIINEYKNKLFLMTYDKRKPVLSHIINNHISRLTNDQKQYLHSFILKYVDCSDVTMKIAAYRTAPMQYILSQEKTGRNMSRIPVLYKDSSVLEIDKKQENNTIPDELFGKQ
jgi:uracil-DNA glycosylase family 4